MDEEDKKSDSIKEGEVLQIANNILGLLEYSQQLTDEEILFSDEFYISILSNLLTEQKADIQPGETPEQKVKCLKELINLLSSIIEMDLSQINVEGIIMNHDKASAKSLLELIEELIKILMKENLEEAEGDNNEEKNKKEKEESVRLKTDKNNSDNKIKKIREMMKLDDENENENEENENSSYKRKYAELENGIDNIDDINNNSEEDEIKSDEKDKDNNLLDINYDLEDKNNSNSSRVMNVSHISEMEKNKINETPSGKKGQKPNKNKKEESSENKASSNRRNKNDKQNKKKSDKIPDLLINKIKDNIEKVEIPRINVDEDGDEEEKEYNEENIINNNYLNSNSLEDESNLYGEENYYVPQSVPRAYNKLQLSSYSKESESSNNKYIRSKKKLNELEDKQNSSDSKSEYNVSFHSKKDNNKKSSLDEYNNINMPSSNKNEELSTNKKNYDNNDLKESKISQSKKSSKSQQSSQNINDDQDDISKSSEYSNSINAKKSYYSSSSKRSKVSQKSNRSNRTNRTNKSNKSNKSKKDTDKNSNIKQKGTEDKLRTTKNIGMDLNFIEIPISNEEMKYIIKKELRKLYGDKATQYFKKDIIELISENLKMARKEIIKYETGVETEDYFSREFYQKYLKEIQNIIKNAINGLNKEDMYKKNVILNIGNNIQFMKKLKDAENKEISNDIEYKQKELDSRNDDANMNILNQILLYPSYCYELQRQVYLAQTQSQIELNLAIEREREKNLEEIKDSYDNRIAVLYEILRRQKKERLNKKKFGELLDYTLKDIKKRKLRKQVEEMLDQIDEEDDKNNFYDNNGQDANQEQIEKLLKNIC